MVMTTVVRTTLSYKEVSGEDDNYDSRPVYLTAFSGDGSRIKRRAGEPLWWWLRSASSSDSGFRFVIRSGSIGNDGNAHNEGGVAISFCL